MSAVIEISGKNKEIISYNPATGEEVGRVPDMGAEMLGGGRARARSFPGWKKTSFAERNVSYARPRGDPRPGGRDRSPYLAGIRQAVWRGDLDGDRPGARPDAVFCAECRKAAEARKGSASASTGCSAARQRSSITRSASSGSSRRGIIRSRSRSARR